MHVLQGVTLTDLKEAQKTSGLSLQDKQVEEGVCSLDDRSCLRKGLTDERRVKIGLTESKETTEICPKWSQLDEVSDREIYADVNSDFLQPDAFFSLTVFLFIYLFLMHIQQGNIEARLETLAECPVPNISHSSTDPGSCGLSYCNSSFRGQRSTDFFNSCVYLIRTLFFRFCFRVKVQISCH